MDTRFHPTPHDVERYHRLRTLSRELNDRMVTTIPRQAYTDIGEALGIMRNGVLVFDSEDMTAVMADSCLYEWFQDGRNLVERYADQCPPEPGTDKGLLFDAYLRAEFGIIKLESAVPDAGVYCTELLSQQKLFLMDRALSRNPSGIMLATRLIPMGDYWMTGGAVLPIVDAKALVRSLDALFAGKQDAPLGRVALFIIRTCLDAGAAERVRYASLGEAPKKRRIEPRHIWRRGR